MSNKQVIEDVLAVFSSADLTIATTRQYIADEINKKLGDVTYEPEIEIPREVKYNVDDYGTLESTLTDEELTRVKNYTKYSKALAKDERGIPEGYVELTPEEIKSRRLEAERLKELRSTPKVEKPNKSNKKVKGGVVVPKGFNKPEDQTRRPVDPPKAPPKKDSKGPDNFTKKKDLPTDRFKNENK